MDNNEANDIPIIAENVDIQNQAENGAAAGQGGPQNYDEQRIEANNNHIIANGVDVVEQPQQPPAEEAAAEAEAPAREEGVAAGHCGQNRPQNYEQPAEDIDYIPMMNGFGEEEVVAWALAFYGPAAGQGGPQNYDEQRIEANINHIIINGVDVVEQPQQPPAEEAAAEAEAPAREDNAAAGHCGQYRLQNYEQPAEDIDYIPMMNGFGEEEVVVWALPFDGAAAGQGGPQNYEQPAEATEHLTNGFDIDVEPEEPPIEEAAAEAPAPDGAAAVQSGPQNYEQPAEVADVVAQPQQPPIEEAAAEAPAPEGGAPVVNEEEEDVGIEIEILRTLTRSGRVKNKKRSNLTLPASKASQRRPGAGDYEDPPDPPSGSSSVAVGPSGGTI